MVTVAVVIIVSILLAIVQSASPLQPSKMYQATSNPTGVVMVTGANGYLASHIVKQLLAKGYIVHACVRDATASHSIGHLQSLPGATSDRLRLFSTGDLANVANCNAFKAPMEGCDTVFHAATPLRHKMATGKSNGKRDIYDPALSSTQEVLDCISRNSLTVKCLILTSSMSAVAPFPEPPIKDESHWSDSEWQKERGSWYGAAKTEQELLTRIWVETALAAKAIDQDFKYCSICPTMIVGPILGPDIGGTMSVLLGWFKGSRTIAPNDSMSFVHVEDCAAMHVAAMELSDSGGRYMSLVESLHWNDILVLLKELCPSLADVTLFDGDNMIIPTQFNLDKMNSLQIPMRSVRAILLESLEYFQSVGVLT